MNLQESWDWLASFTNLEKTLSATKRTWRLDRMDALLDDRGHPERAELSFHLAGSKGKGSTAAYLASILTASGRTTGLYTSPHVSDWRERITLNGSLFEEKVYLRTVGALRSYWDGMDETAKFRFVADWGGEPTTFEWLTLAAFELFRDQETDARVLETGLGGRLDATNAQVPSATVLTLIELEHTDILGDTLSLIAAEKAGILKPGVPVWVAPQKLEVLEVFRSTALKVGAPLHSFDEEIEEFETELNRDGTGLRVAFSDGTAVEARLPLLGRAQGLSAALAAWTFHGMVTSGRLDLAPGDELTGVIRTGLESARPSGRMQVLSRDPWLVVDGAHTTESVRLLVQSWEPLFGKRGTLIFGAFEGKAVESMAALLAPLFPRVIVVPPGTFRPSNPPAVRQVFAAQQGAGTVELAPDAAEALSMAWGDQPVLVCGSFYLVGEILKAWEQIQG